MGKTYSITQINRYIQSMFAQDFVLGDITLEGEISNCKHHSSGHIYFSLKDEGASISAILFAGNRPRVKTSLEDGKKIIARGRIEVYIRDGVYRFYPVSVKEKGEGDLFLRYLALKTELEEMGFFAPEYKKAIPAYCQQVGIITSETGAALQDIISVSKRRNPFVQLILCPVPVQGEGAVAGIIEGIARMDALCPDVIILGRGGGSIEDLWAFNDAGVARAIFEADTPIISAVGHETDFTISDFVADLRAATPSAAAELANMDYAAFLRMLGQKKGVLAEGIGSKAREARNDLEKKRLRLRLLSPLHRINEARSHVGDLCRKLEYSMRGRLTDRRHRLSLICEGLERLSPLRILANGYGFVTDEKGKRMTSVKTVRPGDGMVIHLSDGRIEAEVREVFDERRFERSKKEGEVPQH